MASLDLAVKAYNIGLIDLAFSIIDEELMEGDCITFYAWWLTETNEEYRLADKRFLKDIANYARLIK